MTLDRMTFGRAAAVLLLSVALAACGAAESEPSDSAAGMQAAPDTGMVLSPGLLLPESALWDPEADLYLVSSISGDALGKDDDGFISRIAPSGELLELRWIDGAANDYELHAPKGMALRGDTLFVADIDCVRAFHRTEGTALGEPLCRDEARFFNDLSVGPDGTLWVTDTGLVSGENGLERSDWNQVLVRRTGSVELEVLLSDTALASPNGILSDAPGQAWLVALDTNLVRRIDLDGLVERHTELPAAAVDGIALLPDGALLVSSLEGSIFRVETTDGTVAPATLEIERPADIGYDARRNRVLVPTLDRNVLEIRPVPSGPIE